MIGSQPLSPAAFPLLAVNNTSLTTEDIILISVVVEGQQLPATFFVTLNIDEVILGHDWLTDNGVVWDFATLTVSVKNQRLKLRIEPGKNNSYCCKRCITRQTSQYLHEVKLSCRPILSIVD